MGGPWLGETALYDPTLTGEDDVFVLQDGNPDSLPAEGPFIFLMEDSLFFIYLFILPR